MGKSRMIRINDTYFIESDGNSFELKKDTLTHDKKGNRVYKTLGYYGSLQQALHGYAKKRVLCESIEDELTLSQVRGLLEIIEREIKEVVG